MLRGYKFRLYPNMEQEILINKTFGCSRYIYNYFLEQKSTLYKNFCIKKSAFDCCKDIKVLSSELEWLKEVDSCALRTAVFDLDDAFQNFYRNTGKYPKFKSKYNYKKSYRTNNMTSEYKGNIYNSVKVDLINNLITLPKLGKVKIRGYRNLEYLNGRIINATISKENNRYFVSVCVEEPDIVQDEAGEDIVGIDMGVSNLITTSDNEVYENIHTTDKYSKRLTHLQRELSRKEKGSKNYHKCKNKINVIYRKVKNTRKYYLHEISKCLTSKYKVIVTETLKIKEMISSSKTSKNSKNSNLSKQICDVSWYELIRQLEYKSRHRGVKFYQVDPYYPSSQKCICCGNIDSSMKDLSKREYNCKKCHTKLNRDLNASINIRVEGIKRYFEESFRELVLG